MARRIHFILPVAAALLLLVGFALNSNAQPPYVPNPYGIVSPTGQEIIKAENTGTFVSTISLAQARDASGYTVTTQAATNVYGVVAPGVSNITFTGATSGTVTITTAAAPVDGQKLHIFSVAGFTTITITANTGQTITGAVTSLSANSDVEYQYQLSTLTWFRVA